MNIIEKAVEKLEAEVEDLLREDEASYDRKRDVSPTAVAARPAPGGAEEASTPDAEKTGPSVERDARPERVAVRKSDQVDLDLEALTAAGFVTPLRDQSLLAEEFRIIKRPILERASAESKTHVRDGNLIIVTSSLPGEGKTFNAINLAFSIAMEVDRTVLLVDADVAKSDVSRIFGMSGRRGLSDYLHGTEPDLSKLLVRTNVDTLSVLPSGPRHGRITELLASAQMRSLVSELSQRYPDRIVLFDSSPLLATSGSSVLAGLMGQVIMVVEAVRTPQSAVREALRRLGSMPNVGVIFNKQRRLSHGRYGYDNYGYGYGYGYAEGGAGATEKPA